MAKRFHNLAGWVRDIVTVHRERPEGDGDVDALWNGFVNAVEYALEEIEGGGDDGDSDDAEDGDTDAEDELDSSQLSFGKDSMPQPRGHAERGANRSAPASQLDAILDRLGGPERAAAVAELDTLRRDALAGTQPGAKRLTCMPEGTDGT